MKKILLISIVFFSFSYSNATLACMFEFIVKSIVLDNEIGIYRNVLSSDFFKPPADIKIKMQTAIDDFKNNDDTDKISIEVKFNSTVINLCEMEDNLDNKNQSIEIDTILSALADSAARFNLDDMDEYPGQVKFTLWDGYESQKTYVELINQFVDVKIKKTSPEQNDIEVNVKLR